MADVPSYQRKQVVFAHLTGDDTQPNRVQIIVNSALDQLAKRGCAIDPVGIGIQPMSLMRSNPLSPGQVSAINIIQVTLVYAETVQDTTGLPFDDGDDAETETVTRVTEHPDPTPIQGYRHDA